MAVPGLSDLPRSPAGEHRQVWLTPVPMFLMRVLHDPNRELYLIVYGLTELNLFHGPCRYTTLKMGHYHQPLESVQKLKAFCELNFHDPNVASVSIDLGPDLLVCVGARMYVPVRVFMSSGLGSQQLLMTGISFISCLGRLLSVSLFKGQDEYGGSPRDPFLLIPQRQVGYLRKQRGKQRKKQSAPISKHLYACAQRICAT